MFAIAEWDFKARLVDMQSKLRFRNNEGLVIDVLSMSDIKDVLEYPPTSAFLVVFTTNWCIENDESTIQTTLKDKGFICLTEAEFMDAVERGEV